MSVKKAKAADTRQTEQQRQGRGPRLLLETLASAIPEMLLHPCSSPALVFQYFLRFCDSTNSPLRRSSLEFWSAPCNHSPDPNRGLNSFSVIKTKTKEKTSKALMSHFLLPRIFLKHMNLRVRYIIFKQTFH